MIIDNYTERGETYYFSSLNFPSSVQSKGQPQGPYHVGHEMPYLDPGPHSTAGRSRIASLKMSIITSYVCTSCGDTSTPSCVRATRRGGRDVVRARRASAGWAGRVVPVSAHLGHVRPPLEP